MSRIQASKSKPLVLTYTDQVHQKSAQRNGTDSPRPPAWYWMRKYWETTDCPYLQTRHYKTIAIASGIHLLFLFFRIYSVGAVLLLLILRMIRPSLSLLVVRGRVNETFVNCEWVRANNKNVNARKELSWLTNIKSISIMIWWLLMKTWNRSLPALWRPCLDMAWWRVCVWDACYFTRVRVRVRVVRFYVSMFLPGYLSRVAPQENCSVSGIPARVELGALPFPLSLPVVSVDAYRLWVLGWELRVFSILCSL